jgi:rhamnose utilization protein RhaD (predicted bifunctional aldolase and dehydrogenase)
MQAALGELQAMSARVGRDPNLVQAGGGNTSLKQDGTLWVKASGKWLVHADREPMFLPAPLADVRASIERGQEYLQEHSGMRPSVETTLHAVLPQACVIHVHSVNALAWVVRGDAPGAIADRLEGLRWEWIPYVHPGLPLTLRIRESLASRPDVLLMQNHGLVVAGASCADAEERLHEVERRLAQTARAAPGPDSAMLRRLSSANWQPAAEPEINALATDEFSCAVASGGTMYPDHCVYLGHAVATVRPGETTDDAVNRYETAFGRRPPVLLCEGAGVLVASDLERAGREMLVCLARLVSRISVGTPVRYLERWQVAKLMNWDAERYRIAIAREQEAKR